MSHQQICLEVAAAGQKSRVIVAGTANKNKIGMESNVDRTAEKLAQMK
jgi:hypothetical protein